MLIQRDSINIIISAKHFLTTILELFHHDFPNLWCLAIIKALDVLQPRLLMPAIPCCCDMLIELIPWCNAARRVKSCLPFSRNIRCAGIPPFRFFIWRRLHHAFYAALDLYDTFPAFVHPPDPCCVTLKGTAVKRGNPIYSPHVQCITRLQPHIPMKFPVYRTSGYVRQR